MSESERETITGYTAWDEPRNAIWRAHNSDNPIVIVGEYEKRPEDEVRYLVSSDSWMGISEDEVEFEEVTDVKGSNTVSLLDIGISLARMVIKQRGS